MKQSVVDSFYTWSKQFEGEIPWMYLDVKGLVTTGIGNLIDPCPQALVLPWQEPGGALAGAARIRSVWNAVKSHKECASKGYQYAQQFCPLRLSPDAISVLVQKKIAANWAFMIKQYPKVFGAAEQWPAKAQLATSGMAWAVGAGMPGIFKQWAQHAAAQDWIGCSQTCSISTRNNPGIVPRNAAQRALFEAAATEPAEEHDRV